MNYLVDLKFRDLLKHFVFQECVQDTGQDAGTSIAMSSSRSHQAAESVLSPELKLGSITEIWKIKSEWLKYCEFLDTMEPEGQDSDGHAMRLSRYALFLKLYVDLHHREKFLREETNDPNADKELKKMVSCPT